jgi:hypothetical protein
MVVMVVTSFVINGSGLWERCVDQTLDAANGIEECCSSNLQQTGRFVVSSQSSKGETRTSIGTRKPRLGVFMISVRAEAWAKTDGMLGSGLSNASAVVQGRS